MLREHRLFVRRVLAYVHVAIALVAYSASIALRRHIDVPTRVFVVNEWTHLTLAMTALILLPLCYALLGVYRSNRLHGFWREAQRLALANVIVFCALLAVASGLDLPFTNRLQIGLFSALDTAAVIVVQAMIRAAARSARARGYNFRNLLIVGTGPVSIEHMVRQVKENAWWGLRLVGVVTAPAHAHASGSATAVHASATGNGNGSANGGAHANGNGNGNGHGNGIGVRGALAMAEATETAMETVVEPRPTVFALLPDRAVTLTLEETTRFLDHTPVDELWIEGLPADESPAHRLATDAATRGISVRCLLPQDLFFGARWSVESFGEITTLTAARVPIDEFALALKRPLDFVCAALLLLVTLPVMAVSALAILCTQGTPILFRQSRIGLNGRSFRLYKFRTMYRDAEARLAGLRARNEMTGPVFKMRRDPRITPIGRWLRRLSIDELPQLFNVLKGEMSIVGPRPPTPDEVDLYEPRQRRRLSVRPGITGLWQVNGRSEISSFERWVELDLEYIDHWSLWLDLKILLRTIPAVLLARGAR